MMQMIWLREFSVEIQISEQVLKFCITVWRPHRLRRNFDAECTRRAPVEWALCPLSRATPAGLNPANFGRKSEVDE